MQHRGVAGCASYDVCHDFRWISGFGKSWKERGANRYRINNRKTHDLTQREKKKKKGGRVSRFVP